MRIRKQASKLLGWASCCPFPSSSSLPLSVSEQYSWPLAPPPIQSPEAYAGELQCQLNLSPWDAIESPQCTNSQEAKLEAVNEQMNVFESGVEAEEEEEEEEEIEVKVEDKKGQGRKRREEETEAPVSGAMIKCKKTDGKGWHCKRLAQSPHSLCTYHLTQLRSYRVRFEDHVSGDQQKKSSGAADYAGAASNYYYYYSILGPWWGKRRGSVNETSAWNVDCSVKSTENEVAADDDNAGDEEEEEEEEEDRESRSDATYEKKMKKKRVIKRRGRKPVKARSLKSLL